MNLELDLQIATTLAPLPSAEDFKRWVGAALQAPANTTEICLRVVDTEEMSTLNQTYRNKSGPTNVLSFPSEIPADLAPEYLGDIIFCAPVVTAEAHQEHKTLLDHYAHLTVHGVLHLLGYDHIQEEEAEIMEALEIKILAGLGIPNPYREETM